MDKQKVLRALDGKTYDENVIDAIQNSFDKYKKQLDECDKMIKNAKSVTDCDKARIKINEIKKDFGREHSKAKDTLYSINTQISRKCFDLMSDANYKLRYDLDIRKKEFEL